MRAGFGEVFIDLRRNEIIHPRRKNKKAPKAGRPKLLLLTIQKKGR